jgi:hypothetical protein
MIRRDLEPVPWFMTPKYHFRFLEAMSEIHKQNMSGHPDKQVLEALYEEVRAIPGYPKDYSNPDRYEIVPIVDSVGVY